MRVLKDRLNQTHDAGPALKFELYKDAMRSLEASGYPRPWEGGWTLLRALGKRLLRNDNALDHECAEAIILYGRTK